MVRPSSCIIKGGIRSPRRYLPTYLFKGGVARCGVGRRASPGGVPRAFFEGRPRFGAYPSSAARPLGRQLGSADHGLWMWACGRGAPAPAPFCACPSGHRVLWGRNEVNEEETPLALVGAVYHLARSMAWLPVPWWCSRGPLPLFVGRGGYGRGGPLPTRQRTLLQASFARCGARRMASSGGVLRSFVRDV